MWSSGFIFPTKLGVAGGVTHEFKKITNSDPIRLERYIEEFQGSWEKN